MPSISTSSKIVATQALTPHVIFSGSTSQEREEKVKEVVEQTGAVLIPPYDHGDIVLGQGTVGLELEEQFAGRRKGQVCTVNSNNVDDDEEDTAGRVNGVTIEGAKRHGEEEKRYKRPSKQLDAIITPCGGGGLLSGVSTYFFDGDLDDDTDKNGGFVAVGKHPSAPATTPSILLGQQDEYTQLRQQQPPPHPPTFNPGSIPSTHLTKPQRTKPTPLIFGAEPTHQGADDALRSLRSGHRIPTVKSLTIADGLRTPLGEINWSVISNQDKVKGIYGVSENEIKEAMRLLMERAKWFVEPSAVVGLAVVLYNEEFRGLVQREQQEERRRRFKDTNEAGHGVGDMRYVISLAQTAGETTRR